MNKNQSGSVLAISLVLLTAITLIAIMGLQRSGLQTKIIANIQHREIVFNGTQNLIEDGYGYFQTVDTQELSDAIDKQIAYQYQVSLGTDPSLINGPEKTINLETKLNPNLAAVTSILYKANGNDLDKPNTSALRDDFSRSKNGIGIAKFEFDAQTNLRIRDAISSNQVLGFHFITPGQ